MRAQVYFESKEQAINAAKRTLKNDENCRVYIGPVTTRVSPYFQTDWWLSVNDSPLLSEFYEVYDNGNLTRHG